MEETIKTIDGLLKTWVYIRNTQDINGMLKTQENLSVYSYHLATIVADMSLEHNMSYVARKYQTAKHKNRNRSDGLNVSDSDSKAEEEIQYLRDKEMNDLHNYEMCKLKLQQVNKILSSMQQTISFKKSEYERTRN